MIAELSKLRAKRIQIEPRSGGILLAPGEARGLAFHRYISPVGATAATICRPYGA
jgi:hypothetical protein